MFFIGVDLGTSAVKLLLMDENGKIHKIVSKEYPLYFPHPGWSEQKPEDWFEQSIAGLKELTAECEQEPGEGNQLRWPDAWSGRSGQRRQCDPSGNPVE